MSQELVKPLLADIFKDFEAIIIEGILEEQERFPYTIAYINFSKELKDSNILVDMNAFSEEIQNKIYQELSEFLTR